MKKTVMLFAFIVSQVVLARPMVAGETDQQTAEAAIKSLNSRAAIQGLNKFAATEALTETAAANKEFERLRRLAVEKTKGHRVVVNGKRIDMSRYVAFLNAMRVCWKLDSNSERFATSSDSCEMIRSKVMSFLIISRAVKFNKSLEQVLNEMENDAETRALGAETFQANDRNQLSTAQDAELRSFIYKLAYGEDNENKK